MIEGRAICTECVCVCCIQVLEQTILECWYLRRRTFLGRWTQLFVDGSRDDEGFPGSRNSLFYRFEKRIYIPLPGVNERAAMFKTHLGANTYHTIRENEWMQLAQRSEQ